MKFKAYFIVFMSFLMLFFLPLKAQEEINKFDLNGKRQGVWKKYYSNNKIRYEGTFKAGKEIGVFKYYDITDSTHPTIIKTFKPNSPIASVSFYTVKGVIESTGTMDGKNRIGKWLYYYPDGKTLMIEENYVNGVLEGTFTSYYKTGKITEIINYSSGKLNGNTKRYADNGVLLDDLNYKDGKLEGSAKYYNTDGKLIYAGEYKDDEKIGEWEFYKDGKIENINNLKQ